MLIHTANCIQEPIMNGQVTCPMLYTYRVCVFLFRIYCCINRMYIKSCINHNQIILLLFQKTMYLPEFMIKFWYRKTTINKIKAWKS